MLAVFSVVSLLLTLPALAHTELVSAAPAPGAVAPPTLAEIRLTFNEPLSPGSTLELLAENFQKVPGLAPQIDGSTLSAKLTAPLAAGQYTVQWKAIGEDGHAVEGSYPFSVSAEAQNVTTAWTVSAIVLLVIVGLSAIGYGSYRRKGRRA
jgi:methionine-rich copper-binding protein CopC